MLMFVLHLTLVSHLAAIEIFKDVLILLWSAPKPALVLIPLVTQIPHLLLLLAKQLLNIVILLMDVDLMLNVHLHAVDEVSVMVLIAPLLEFVLVPQTRTRL
jgi:hypothetical protein